MIREWCRAISERTNEPEICFSIIRWWEVRRVLYNLIVGFVGAISVGLVFLFVFLPPPDIRAETGVKPFSVLIFGVLANIFYTGGWIVELALRPFIGTKGLQFGPKAFRAGLMLSLLLVALPALAYGFMWIGRVMGYEFRELI